MKEAILGLTIQSLMAKYPSVIQFLLDNRIGCVGCLMNKYCTVDEMIEDCDLDRDEVIKALTGYMNETGENPL